jgi:hypothetical protein
MSGRGGRQQSSGRGGRGAYGRGGAGGRGSNYSGASTGGAAKQKGDCIALGEHVFDYGQKGSADQLRTTWEKIITYAGTNYGQDICNELRNKKKLIISQPQYSQDILDLHQERVKIQRTLKQRVSVVKEKQRKLLAKQAEDEDNLEAPMKLATLESEIADDQLMANTDPPIKVTDEQKSDRDLARKHSAARITELNKHRGQAYSKIYGQCMPILLDKMKHHPDWANSQSDPLALICLISYSVNCLITQV